MSVAARQLIEKEIARRTIQSLLEKGYAISVHDGEETTVKRSLDKKVIIEAMFTTDEDILYVHANSDTKAFGWIMFVYGNDGHDVISDYTTNLEEVLAPVNAYANAIETGDVGLLNDFYCLSKPTLAKVEGK